MKNTLYENKFRIDTIRLKGWDYTQDGMYFVTICTKERELCFGNIENNEMKLSKIGEITRKYWNEIPEHFTNVELDEYVIMPNHVHGIIVINNNDNGCNDYHCKCKCRDEALPRLYNENNNNNKFAQMSKISPKPNSLSSIIGSYKSICAKQIHKLYNFHFQWQARFYDHIIRNEESLGRVREYIRDNQLKWEFDRNNPECKPYEKNAQ